VQHESQSPGRTKKTEIFFAKISFVKKEKSELKRRLLLLYKTSFYSPAKSAPGIAGSVPTSH
jgi:hypothetical protein